MKRKYLILSICYIFFGLFTYTSIAKLVDFKAFRTEIGESPLKGRLALPLAVSVPTVEILVGLALMFPRYRLRGLYASTVLMGIFTVYIVALLRQDNLVSCDCGGLLEQIDLNTHLWINIGLLLLALAGVVLYKMQQNHALAWEVEALK